MKKKATKNRYQQFKNRYDAIIKVNRVGRLVFKNDPAHLALFESKWPKSSTVVMKEAAETLNQ